jgi:hypothetical protein
MKDKCCCKRPWFYLGIISGFLAGFFYFAYGVYTHVQNKNHHGVSGIDLKFEHPGSVQ